MLNIVLLEGDNYELTDGIVVIYFVTYIPHDMKLLKCVTFDVQNSFQLRQFRVLFNEVILVLAMLNETMKISISIN